MPTGAEREFYESLKKTRLLPSEAREIWDARSDQSKLQQALTRYRNYIPDALRGEINERARNTALEITGSSPAGRAARLMSTFGIEAKPEPVQPAPGAPMTFGEIGRSVAEGLPIKPTITGKTPGGALGQFALGTEERPTLLGGALRSSRAIEPLSEVPGMLLEPAVDVTALTPERGAARGVAEFATGMASPAGLALGALGLPAIGATAGSRLLSQMAARLGLGASLAYEAGKRVPGFFERLNEIVKPGSDPELVKIQQEEMTQALLESATGLGLIRSGLGPLRSVARAGAAPKAAAGVAGARAGLPPPRPPGIEAPRPLIEPPGPRTATGRRPPAGAPRAMPGQRPPAAPRFRPDQPVLRRDLPPMPGKSPFPPLPTGAPGMPPMRQRPKGFLPRGAFQMGPAAGVPQDLEATGGAPPRALDFTPSDMAKPGGSQPLSRGRPVWMKAGESSVMGEWAVVRNRDLVTSNSSALVENPDYPQFLQNRDRSSRASEASIRQIQSRLDPEQLGESYLASDGAPVIGGDMVVEAGNGRTIALRREYDSETPRAARYRDWLLKNAERFGVDPKAIESVPDPQLVRIRSDANPIDRMEFARLANVSQVAQLSPAELASQDAARMPPRLLELFDTESEAGLLAESNRDFVRGFAETLVEPSEQPGFMAAGGELSSQGLTRVRNAIIAKAYGDPQILARVAESANDEQKNILGALVGAAPRMVYSQKGIADGVFHDLPIHQDAARAANLMTELAGRGFTVEDFVRQQSLFATGRELTAEQEAIARYFEANARSPRKLQAYLDNYNEALVAAGNPRQSAIFGGRPPSRVDLLEAARQVTEAEYAEKARQRKGLREAEAKPGRRAQVGQKDAGLKARLGDRQLQPFQGSFKNPVDLMQGADMVYRKPRKNRPGMLFVNEGGSALVEIMSGHMGSGQLLGAQIPEKASRSMLKRMDEVIGRETTQLLPWVRDKLQLMRLEMQRALDDNGQILVARADRPMGEVKETIRHERAHYFMEALGLKVDPVALLSDPLFYDYGHELTKLGYGNANARQIVEEIANYAMAGRGNWKQIGMPRVDARQVVASWIMHLAERNGSAAFAVSEMASPELFETVRIVREQASEAFGIDYDPATVAQQIEALVGGGRPAGGLEHAAPAEGGAGGGPPGGTGGIRPPVPGDTGGPGGPNFALRRPRLDPKIEQQLAATAKKANALTRAKDFLGERFIHEWKVRHLPEFSNRLRLFRGAGIDSARRAVTQLETVLEGLRRDEYKQFFSPLAILYDFRATAQRGLGLPNDIDPVAVDQAIAALEKAAPKPVFAALARHMDLVQREVGADLVARGKITPGAAASPYFPHMVMDYSERLGEMAWMPSRLRTPGRRYARKRSGSKRLINPDYIDVMYKHLMRVHLDNAVDDFIQGVANDYDQLGSLTPQERLNLFGKTRQPRPDELVEIQRLVTRTVAGPRGPVVQRSLETVTLVGWSPNPGNRFENVNTITDARLDKAKAQQMTADQMEQAGMFGERLAMAGPTKTYLLEPAIAERLNKFREPKQNSILMDLPYGTPEWKRWTLAWAGLPFQVHNFVGDAAAAYLFMPSYVGLVVGNAAGTVIGGLLGGPAGAIIGGYGGSILGGAMGIEFFEAIQVLSANPPPHLAGIKDMMYAQRVVETSTLQGGEVLGQVPRPELSRKIGPLVPFENPYIEKVFGGWKGAWAKWNPLHLYETAGTYRESLLRTAIFLRGMKKIQAGQYAQLERRMAKMFKVSGLKPIDVVGKASRRLLVDYGESAPVYEREVRGLVLPFVHWAASMTYNVGRYAWNFPFELAAKIGIPLTLLYLWNTMGDRAESEANAPDYLRSMTHFNTGWRDDEGKEIWIAFENPWDMFARVFGFDKARDYFEQVERGEITPLDAGAKFARDVMIGKAGPLAVAHDMLHPVAKILEGWASGKDQFSGRPICPPSIEGTGECAMIKGMWGVGQLFSPVGAFLRAENVVGEGGPLRRTLQRPIDWQRALGIYKVDPYQNAVRRNYESQAEAEAGYNEMMYRLETALIARETMGDVESFYKEDFDRIVNEYPFGGSRVAMDIVKRQKSVGFQARRTREMLIKGDLTEAQREQLKRQLEALQDRQMIESRKNIRVGARPVLPPLPAPEQEP